MDSGKIIVYAGPTISHLDIGAILPDAELRPPITRGDLFREEWACNSVAIIIDGYFREKLSVGHKEILWLLDQGVRVIGSASMGALRAAELYPYGMIGFGHIFHMYVNGEIDGDDEVAVQHGPREIGYHALSAALVNVRYACQEGARTGEIPGEVGQKIIQLVKSLPFMDRDWKKLKQDQSSESLDAINIIQFNIENGIWDLKKLDSVIALNAAAKGLISDTKTPKPSFALSGITHYEALKWKTLRGSSSETSMTDFDVLDAARLFDQAYPELHEQVLARLQIGFAQSQGVDLSTYTSLKFGIDHTEELPPVLCTWLTETELATLPRSEHLRLVMIRVWPSWQSTDWRPRVIEEMRRSDQWQKWNEIVIRADEVAKHRPIPNPPPEVCGKLFLRHWNGKLTSDRVEMAKRGFYDVDELGSTVQRFFALDVEETITKRGN